MRDLGIGNWVDIKGCYTFHVGHQGLMFHFGALFPGMENDHHEGMI